jgi:ribose transport system permease protein
MKATTHKFTLYLKTSSREYLGMLIVLALLILFFSWKTTNFFSPINLKTIANQITVITIIAVGMTYVLIIAGIDLSVGSVLGFCGAVMGVLMVQHNIPLPWALLACLATGLLCGLLNGVISVRWNLPSFIVTLGMMQIARGLCQQVTDSETQYIGSAVEVITDTKLLGVALPVLVALFVVIAGQLVLTRTVFGRYMIAIGTNEEAVRLSGIDPRPIKITVFVLCSVLTSLAAVIQVARNQSASPNSGNGLELQAIAAVVIGGTSLMGGSGSVVRSFLGVLIIAVLDAGLNQMGAKDATKQIIIGSVIVAAVILDQYRHRSRKSKGATSKLVHWFKRGKS